MPFIPIIIIILVVVLILVLATNLKVVQQSKAYVIERLGAYQGQRHHADRHGSLLPDHRP